MGSKSSPFEATQDESFLYAMQLASGSVLPMALKAAIELDLLETIAKAGPGGSLSSSELVVRLANINNPEAPVMVDRICNLLASHSVLTCSLKETGDGCVHRVYGLAPVCKYLTKNEGGVSLAPLVLMHQNKTLMESWYYLKDAVMNGGIPFNKAYGMSAFEYSGKDEKFNKFFNNAMYGHSSMTMKKIVELYDGFKGVTTLVDVGGNIGGSLNMIVSKYTSIKGLNFDLPHVVAQASTYPGIEHVGGNMFESVPNGDAMFMKWILHDWSDAHCLTILKNCYKALPDNGKVIVADCILPEAPDSTTSTQYVTHIDLTVLAYTPGGKERTEKEFEALAKEAGFKGFRKAACAFNTWVMEFTK